jgi:tetratricopeptide (TPR) repeat protein
MLQQSEREAPDDYNPPARLARAYLTLGQLEPAEAAIERALPHCEGPRKLRLFMLKSDILLARNQRESAAETLRAALRYANDKQLGAQYDKLRHSIERKVASL